MPTLLGTFSSAIFFLLTAATLFGCASMADSMREMITDGKYKEAIIEGEQWLKEERAEASHEEVHAVWRLVGEAAFKQAEETDTIETYRRYLVRYGEDAILQDLRTLAKKKEASAYYRDRTLKIESMGRHRRFRKLYPKAREVADSRKREATLAFAMAKRKESMEALNSFRKIYSEMAEAKPLVSKARGLEAGMLMEKAREADTPAAYRGVWQYCGKWPEAVDVVKEARAKEVALSWEETLEKDTLDAYRLFNTFFHQREEAAESLAVSRPKEVKLALAQAMKAEAAEPLHSFRVRYKEWPEAAEALIKAEVAEENLAWAATVKEDSWIAYRRFLQAFPYSARATEAEDRARILQALVMPAGPGELSTQVSMVHEADSGEASVFLQAIDKQGDPVGGLKRSHFSVYQRTCQANVTGFQGMESDRPVDVVFVFDTTGSMEKYIKGVKHAAVGFAEALAMRNRDLRLGLVSFGDEVRLVFPKRGPLVSRVKTFRRWVSGLKSHGGGDGPENPLDALKAALKFRFRPKAQKIFILIVDAPAHSRNRVTRRSFPEVAKDLRDQQVMLTSISPAFSEYQNLVSNVGGFFFDIRAGGNFGQVIEKISTITAKQYELRIKPCAPLRAGGSFNLKVRARQDHIWLSLGKVPAQLVSMVFLPGAQPSVLACGGKGQVLLSANGSRWETVGKIPGGVCPSQMWITSEDGKTVLGRTPNGKLFLTRDGGKAWAGLEIDWRADEVVQDAPRSPNLFARAGMELLRTQDGGGIWSKVGTLPKGGPWRLWFEGGEMSTLWLLGSKDNARCSLTGGVTWKTLQVTLPPGITQLSDLRLFGHPYWPGMLLAIMPDGKVFRSVNRGKTWLNVTPGSLVGGGKALVALRVHFDRSLRHWIYVSTNRGIFVSADRGRTWSGPLDGIPSGASLQDHLALSESGTLLYAHMGQRQVYALNAVNDREFISGSVYFATNSHKIRGRLKPYLIKLAAYLIKHPEHRVHIEGHTDDRGSQAYNLKLSMRRAESVRKFLAKRGVDDGRMSIAGLGKVRPLFPNKSARYRARNRRVEIMLLARHQAIESYAGLHKLIMQATKETGE